MELYIYGVVLNPIFDGRFLVRYLKGGGADSAPPSLLEIMAINGDINMKIGTQMKELTTNTLEKKF